MINEAREKADGMMREARHEFESETHRLKTMKKEVSDFKARLLDLYKSHLDIITKIPEFDSDISDKNQKFKKEGLRAQSDEIYSSDDESLEEVENFEAKPEKPDASNARPMFKMTMTDGSSSIQMNDHVRSRFGGLRFGENKN